ncbi:MAG: glycosyltransferase family 61 protein [Proteobacteria bacterium]|nr:glycosyltransferase family 61 protein [Pseudomonadota bacterium]MBU1708654.1 glycosyltransferase family 61 protein [Pseudomonadota bacterium]
MKVLSKIAKFIHDANASTKTALGVPLIFVQNHPQIVDSTLILTAGRSTHRNHFEEEFYGDSSTVDFSHPERFVHTLENVWVTGSEGHVFFDANTILNLCPSLEGVSPKKIRRPVSLLAERVDDPVFILAGRAPGNRAHFLMEHLPRLVACLDFLKQQKGCKILVTPGHRSWQLGYLEKIGIPASDVIEGSQGAVFCKKAFYIPLLSEGGREVICQDRYYEQIRELFAPEQREQKTGAPIFLSRQDAATRRLINEDAVFGIAAEFFPGMKRITMSGLSLEEQLGLLQQAPVIIGPHGQPFRYALFCKNSLIIQLVPGERTSTNEYHLWARNFNSIGVSAGSTCISIYNEENLESGAADWEYKEEKLIDDLSRVVALHKTSK